jgi:SET domain-containing protein
VKINRRAAAWVTGGGVTALLVSALALYAVQRDADPSRIVPVDLTYESRTAIRPSEVPGAGNGLFAVRYIAQGEVIGELGGRLIDDDDPAAGNHYTAALSACAMDLVPPYTRLDSVEHGGHVSRINFAPRTINGVPTHLQSAAIEQRCGPPYVVFVALRDIHPGEEILASYGPDYDYGFMQRPDVRAYFCEAVQVDCSEDFAFEP